MKNIVFEGARGTGKSTVARYVRDNTTNSTLINFTGFNEKGQEGLQKIASYYSNWYKFFHNFKGADLIFVHDRFYFSEMVYSKLYKDYDFSNTYYFLNKAMPAFFDDIQLVFLVASRDTLKMNLDREKVRLFGDVQESVEQSMKQQAEYYMLLEKYMESDERPAVKIPGFSIEVIDVNGKTIKEIGDEILALSR